MSSLLNTLWYLILVFDFKTIVDTTCDLLTCTKREEDQKTVVGLFNGTSSLPGCCVSATGGGRSPLILLLSCLT